MSQAFRELIVREYGDIFALQKRIKEAFGVDVTNISVSDLLSRCEQTPLLLPVTISYQEKVERIVADLMETIAKG